MSVSRESELKQQGALEAARDPHSTVTADQAERKVVDEVRKAGGHAFQFDANASPEEKAAQISAAIPAGLTRDHKPKAAALASDQDSAPAQYNLETATKLSMLSAASPDPRAANGAIESGEDDPEWERVGWQPRFGLPGSFDADVSLQDHQTWLDGKLDDKFFGDWWQNTGVIIFACLTSWVIAVLGGGLGWVFLVMAFCGTYYRTSIRRVRRNYRDDINRELSKARLETDVESLEWINSFLVKFWPIYAPVLCKTIVSSVDQVLSTSTPAFLDSLRLKTFTLGTKPPRLEHVKTYPKSEDDIVLMDWKFSFTPNDTADMTARQIKVKQNPKVVLEIRIGKGMVSKGLDVIVEDMACSGLMRVKMKLMLPFPHIDRVEICFLERPVIDYVCKPLGGDLFGLDTNFIPGLSTFILEQIHANLGPMMYAPNVFPIEIAKMLAGAAIDQAIGVLQIQFHGGQGLGAPGGGTPDPYALVTINGRTELARTKTVKQNANPRWNETINIIVASLKDTLDVQVFDYNEYRKDRLLGNAVFSMERLEEVSDFENETLEVLSNGKARGILTADIRFFPVLGETKLEDGTVVPPPESLTGIAQFTVEQAKDLDGTKSLIGQLNPYAVLLLNGKEVHVSKKLKRTNNPIWTDANKELLITNRKNAKLGLVLKDDRDLAGDPIIGTYQINLDDLLECTQKGQDWFNLAGVKTGRAKMMLQWRPVALTGALGGDGYITPIGVMRFHFRNARDLKNLETVGKSDPYIRVLLSGVQKGRTVTFKNNLNPDWDEVVYVPVHTSRERLTIECMDEEVSHRDRSLGHFEISVADYLAQNEDGEYEVNDTKKTISQSLTLGLNKQPKGIVNYTCSFFPTLSVIDPEEEEKEKALQATGEPMAKQKSHVSDKSTTVSASQGSVPKKSLDVAREPLRGRSNTSGTISSLRTIDPQNGSPSPGKGIGQPEQIQEEAIYQKKEPPKIRITAEDLVNYGMDAGAGSVATHPKSGLLVFKLIEADLAHTHCHLEVLIDDMAFPSYSSGKVKTRHHIFNEVGDAMIRELDQSRITIRLMEQIDKEGKGKEDRSMARLSGPTLQTLQRCLYQPHQLVLRDDHGQESKVTVSLKFLPVKMKLDPSESFTNMGKLRVDVMDATDLPAADRNGFSDPYCKFILNDVSVYKTDKQRKTLHPAWNESFETMVRSRTAAKFVCEVYDWDFGDSADFLGKTDINLEILEPFVRKEVTLALDGKSGAVRLRLLFTPEFVTRHRQGTSTFQGTFATPGKVIGAPVKGVGKGVATIGGGVSKAGSIIGRGFRRRKSGKDHELHSESREGTPNGDLLDEMGNGSAGPDVPIVSIEGPDQAQSSHMRNKSWGQQSRPDSLVGGLSGAEQGTADITLVSVSGFHTAANMRVIIRADAGKGIKDVHKTKPLKYSGAEHETLNFDQQEESVKFPCTADTAFKITVMNDHRLRSDESLGEGSFFLADQGAGGERSVKVGSGQVTLRTRFVASDAASSIGGPKQGGRLSRAFGRNSREKSVTPAGP